ncbi:unnamed protein product [Closterium sp. NIES-54]
MSAKGFRVPSHNATIIRIPTHPTHAVRKTSMGASSRPAYLPRDSLCHRTHNATIIRIVPFTPLMPFLHPSPHHAQNFNGTLFKTGVPAKGFIVPSHNATGIRIVPFTPLMPFLHPSPHHAQNFKGTLFETDGSVCQGIHCAVPQCHHPLHRFTPLMPFLHPSPHHAQNFNGTLFKMGVPAKGFIVPSHNATIVRIVPFSPLMPFLNPSLHHVQNFNETLFKTGVPAKGFIVLSHNATIVHIVPFSPLMPFLHPSSHHVQNSMGLSSRRACPPRDSLCRPTIPPSSALPWPSSYMANPIFVSECYSAYICVGYTGVAYKGGVPPRPLPPPTPLLLLLTSLVLRMSGLLLLMGSAAAARERVAGVVAVAAGVVVGAELEVVSAVEVVTVVGVVAGVGALVAAVVAEVGVAVFAAVGVVAVGLELLSVEVLAVARGSTSSVRARPCRPSSFVSGFLSVGHLGAERPRWAELLRSGVAIFDLDYDAILAAMYALSVSAEGDYYLCVPPDPGIEAPTLGAGESALPGTAPAEALHTFTLDSGASGCFFRNSTTLTPLSAPVPVRLADPSGGPVLARSSTVLPCPAVSSGSLSGLHLPSFSTKSVMPSLYTLATNPPQVAASAQVSASGPVALPCSCCLMLHQTILWHRRLGHPSLPRLLVSGLPRSLPPLPPLPAPPCLLCVEGRQRAAPHSSSFPPTTAPLQTLHMDVWGPARVSGQGRERYFLLVVDDYTRYTTVFPLRSQGEVPDVLIPWIRAFRLLLRERFRADLPVMRLHSDRGGEFSSDLLRDFCRGEGILQSFMLPASPQQNGSAEHRIGFVMEVARTSMIHAAAPHFQWSFVVHYAAHQLNLWPRVSLPETSPTLRWTGKVGDALVSRGPAPSGVSQVDPLSRTMPVEAAVGSGATSGGAASGGAETRGAESKGGGSRGPAGGSPRLSPWSEPLSSQQLREWFAKRTRLWSGAAGAGVSAVGDTGVGGVGVTAGAGGARGAAAAGPGGTKDTGGAGTGSVGGAGAGGAGAGDPALPGGAGAGGAGAGDTGTVDPKAGGAGAGGVMSGGTGDGGTM